MCGGNAHNAISQVLFIRFAKDDCAWIPPGELKKLPSTYKNKQEILTFRFPEASIVYRFVFSLHLLTKKKPNGLLRVCVLSHRLSANTIAKQLT